MDPVEAARSGLPSASREERIDGVLVLGAFGSGTDLVSELLDRLGLHHGSFDPGESARPEGGSDELSRLNDALLVAAGGSSAVPPLTAPRELARRIDDRAPDAVRAFHRAFGIPSGFSSNGEPWVWADPRLCFLAPFWVGALAISPLAVLVHRDPARTPPAEGGASGADDGEALERWGRYSRAALGSCEAIPTMVVSYESIVEDPPRAADRLVSFLRAHGVAVDGPARGRDRALPHPSSPARLGGLDVKAGSAEVVLHALLGKMEEWVPGWAGERPGDQALAGMVESTADFYGEPYYRGRGQEGAGSPADPSDEASVERVADGIAHEIDAQRVLDAGCATGRLVDALRRRGVDAWGLDISPWAIKQIADELQPYCSVGSVTDPLTRSYDLVTCIDVLDHLPPAAARLAVANLCEHTEAVLIGTADDNADPSRLNVQPMSYWAQLMAEQGFVRDFEHVPAYVPSRAVLFRRIGTQPLTALIGSYEQMLPASSDPASAVANHEAGRLGRDSEIETLRQQIDQADLRRSAEATAAARHIEALDAGHAQLRHELNLRITETGEARAEVDALRSTKVFRYTRRLRRLYGFFRAHPHRRGSDTVGRSDVEERPRHDDYDAWVRVFDTMDEARRASIGTLVGQMTGAPLISVLMPVFDPPAHLLRLAIESVRAQIYPHWELCIADDGSHDPSVRQLLTELSALDPRIRVHFRETNGHISAACNSALALATGSWVAALDHDDELPEHALAVAALELDRHPGAGMLYSDEDKIDLQGHRHGPFFKPEFDPLLLVGQNYLCHLTMIRTDLVHEIGGYREGFEGSQDWDLALRASEALDPHEIVHVPHVLYHWRAHPGSTALTQAAKPYAASAGHRAVSDHLARRGVAADVVTNPTSGWNRVKWALPEEPPLVSIVVPTRDGLYLSRCIESITRFTTYPSYEIVIVDNGSIEHSTLEYLRSKERSTTVLRDERPFNYSALNNLAVGRCSGSVICLMNDDCEVLAGDWLDEMVSQLLQPAVGAVGAKLLYPDGRVQHAGVVLGVTGVAGHGYRFADRISDGHFGNLQLARNVSASTGACLVVRKEAWDQVRGLDAEHLAVTYNDVDLCLRIREAGWRVVWTPFAELTHHESVTRGSNTGAKVDGLSTEVEYMKARWGQLLRNDPAYNPNLTLEDESYGLSWPPRVAAEWLRAIPGSPGTAIPFRERIPTNSRRTASGE